MNQCGSVIKVWEHEGGGYSTLYCRKYARHDGTHSADWMESTVRWDFQPQCGAKNPDRAPGGQSHALCLDAQGHDGPHWSRWRDDLKVAWTGDARFQPDLMRPGVYVAGQSRYDFCDDLASPTAQKLYAATDVQQAVWAHEGKAWEQILLAGEPRRADQTSLGSPRTYAERKNRRKKVNP